MSTGRSRVHFEPRQRNGLPGSITYDPQLNDPLCGIPEADICDGHAGRFLAEAESFVSDVHCRTCEMMLRVAIANQLDTGAIDLREQVNRILAASEIT